MFLILTEKKIPGRQDKRPNCGAHGGTGWIQYGEPENNKIYDLQSYKDGVLFK